MKKKNTLWKIILFIPAMIIAIGAIIVLFPGKVKDAFDRLNSRR